MHIKNLLLATLGTFLIAITINCIIIPTHIFVGGIPALVVIFIKIFGNNETYTQHTPLLIAGFSILLGAIQYYFLRSGEKKNILKSIYGMLLIIIFTHLTLPYTNTLLKPFTSNTIFALFTFPYSQTLSAIIDIALFAGTGIGLIIRANYSLIGTLGITQILCNKLKMKPNVAMLAVEGSILSVGGYYFGIEQLIISLITLFLMTQVMKSVINL